MKELTLNKFKELIREDKVSIELLEYLKLINKMNNRQIKRMIKMKGGLKE
jgi:hypothetical protein